MRNPNGGNPFLLVNAAGAALSGTEYALNWKCLSDEQDYNMLRNVTSHEFSGMPHAPANHLQFNPASAENKFAPTQSHRDKAIETLKAKAKSLVTELLPGT